MHFRSILFAVLTSLLVSCEKNDQEKSAAFEAEIPSIQVSCPRKFDTQETDPTTLQSTTKTQRGCDIGDSVLGVWILKENDCSPNVVSAAKYSAISQRGELAFSDCKEGQCQLTLRQFKNVNGDSVKNLPEGAYRYCGYVGAFDVSKDPPLFKAVLNCTSTSSTATVVSGKDAPPLGEIKLTQHQKVEQVSLDSCVFFEE